MELIDGLTWIPKLCFMIKYLNKEKKKTLASVLSFSFVLLIGSTVE